MEHKNFVPNNTSADLAQSWHIPRPTLARTSKSSQGSTSSNNSTQSAKSGSLLLTAANLAQIHDATKVLNNRDQNIQYYLQQTIGHEPNQFEAGATATMPVGGPKKPDPDSVSIASSMHFTVVNMNTRPPVKRRSICKKHQLTVLVVSMSVLFTIGILAAVLFLEMRAKRQQFH